MHLARLIKPYNAARSQELQKHAEMAFAAAGDAVRPTHKLYYAVQKYLLTGDEAAHQMVKDLSTNASGYADNFNGAPESFASNGWLASYFYSYIVAKDRPTDPAVVDRFKAAIKAAADKEIGYLAGQCLPGGHAAESPLVGQQCGSGPICLSLPAPVVPDQGTEIHRRRLPVDGLRPRPESHRQVLHDRARIQPRPQSRTTANRPIPKSRDGALVPGFWSSVRAERAVACRFPPSPDSPANAGISTIWDPSSGASSPSIRASVFPRRSTRCWPKAASTTSVSIHSARAEVRQCCRLLVSKLSTCKEYSTMKNNLPKPRWSLGAILLLCVSPVFGQPNAGTGNQAESIDGFRDRRAVEDARQVRRAPSPGGVHRVAGPQQSGALSEHLDPQTEPIGGAMKHGSRRMLSDPGCSQ